MTIQKILATFFSVYALTPAAAFCQSTAPRLPVSQSEVGVTEEGRFARYRSSKVPAILFTDSERLNTLIRAGSLYLSLRDAIALALENNLDIELQRLGPRIAETDVLRARAGGSGRGVSVNVREGPSGVGGATTQDLGGAQGTQTQGISSQLDQSIGSQATSNVSLLGAGATSPGTPVPSLEPAIVGSVGWNRSNRPQTNTFITGTNAITSTSTSGDLRVQQGFLTGGVASFGYDTSRDDSNNLRADVNPSTTSGVAASFTQPLLRGFGIAVNNRFIRVANNNRQVAAYVFEQQVLSTVYAVTRLYWDLVSLNEDMRVRRQTLELADQLLRDNVQQEEAGTIAPIEVVRARAEVARARRDLTVGETRLRQQETVLKDFLTRGSVDSPVLASLRVIATDSIPRPEQQPIQPLQDLVAAAVKRRPDVAEASLQLENSEISLAGSKSALLPSLDLVANARSNALFGSVNPLPPAPGEDFVRQPDPAFIGGLGTGLSQIFNTRFPDYGVQLQLNIPLLNRAARADYTRDQLTVRQQQIRLRQIEKQVRVDVVNALIAVEQAQAAYEAGEQSRILQEQALEAEKLKYAAGVSTNYFVIQYQRDLAQAQSAEVVALTDYVKARSALDRSTGQLLDTFGIKIEDAYQGRVPVGFSGGDRK